MNGPHSQAIERVAEGAPSRTIAKEAAGIRVSVVVAPDLVIKGPYGTGEEMTLRAPWDGTELARIPTATLEDMDVVLDRARTAAEAYRWTPAWKRAAVLEKASHLIEENAEQIAHIIAAEGGKPLKDARVEAKRGASTFRWASEEAKRTAGEIIEMDADPSGENRFGWTIREPRGVIAAISPFNFPLNLVSHKVAPALAGGNAVVLKPASNTPLTALRLAEVLAEAGLPDGVFNVLQGDRVAVSGLTEHPDIAAISFVGSTPAAKQIYERGSRAGKRVQALGGAKNHMLVLPDADIGMTADAAVSAGYGSAGERCMAIATLVTVGDVHDRLIEAIKERLPKVVIEDGTKPEAQMGPLVTEEHRDRVAAYIDSGRQQGATIVADGRDHPLYKGSEGFFLGVSLIDDVTPDMDCYKDEIFGPVLTVVRCATYEEAVELINSHEYGNGTAIFTRDGGAARQFQFDIDVGMVGINVPIPVPVASYSFGGWRSSLFGDLHMYGPEGVQFYTRGKVVTSRWPDPATSKVDLGFPRTR
jgi:malonate-semialdehyde dehydrogenase (acetylating)/methylmalonate-semialdehyde dehydrogenase